MTRCSMAPSSRSTPTTVTASSSRTTTTLVFGPETAAGGLLDTDLLDEGMYWIVESTVPAGFEGSDPILVELNTDPPRRASGMPRA